MCMYCAWGIEAGFASTLVLRARYVSWRRDDDDEDEDDDETDDDQEPAVIREPEEDE